jgi:hypothetical protein
VSLARFGLLLNLAFKREVGFLVTTGRDCFGQVHKDFAVRVSKPGSRFNDLPAVALNPIKSGLLYRIFWAAGANIHYVTARLELVVIQFIRISAVHDAAPFLPGIAARPGLLLLYAT